MNSYICRYCRQPGDPGSPACPLCGAPVDIRPAVSDSGWVEQPPIPDMARLQFGQSRCQIEGTTVPVADFALAPGDMIYFSHHVLLWADPAIGLGNMPMRGGWKRMMSGLPLIMMEARGPGRVALSDNRAGEIVALPLARSQSMWVREHRFLCATGGIGYDWQPNDVWYDTGEDHQHPDVHYPLGRSGDIFTASRGPGLLLLHAPGNTFVRDLRAGQSLLVQPGSLLYRDVSVTVNLHLEYPLDRTGARRHSRWSYRAVLLRVHGPGRVAVQSVYEPAMDAEAIRAHSRATARHW
jgi:uncharacterized protein (AIM24 family)